MKLVEIVGDRPAGKRVRLAADRGTLFDICTDGVSECNAELQVLELQSMYMEKYLLAYTADEDEG